MNRNDYIKAMTAESLDMLAKREIVVAHLRTQSGIRGTVTVCKDMSGGLLWGWSLCNPKDKFNRHIGIAKAASRMGTICNASGDQDGCQDCFPDHPRELLQDTVQYALGKAQSYFYGKGSANVEKSS